jgi:ABC-type Mn2+/Zn2+ transport system ATPase subunit
VFTAFRSQRAANSLDIDTKKKAVHELSIAAELDSDFNVGLIVGSSGSGKTTLARQIFGDAVFENTIDPETPIIEQLPQEMTYDECAETLSGIGLTSVPCWIRPVKTLSNGQRARAEAALAMSRAEVVVIDEWTSVVDRTVAKVMSHCVQKSARRKKKRVILLSCHYDVIEWLNPDWVIDCNSQKFIDRRLLQADERARSEKLRFDIRPVTQSSWRHFSKYHYLTEANVGGRTHHFGLYHGPNQIGYNCLANYVPWVDKSRPMLMHVSRTVIHPDYAGMGLGIKLDTEVSRHGRWALGYRIVARFSSVPFYKMMSRHPEWRLLETKRIIGVQGGSSGNSRIARAMKTGKKAGFRENVKIYLFDFIGERTAPAPI